MNITKVTVPIGSEYNYESYAVSGLYETQGVNNFIIYVNKEIRIACFIDIASEFYRITQYQLPILNDLEVVKSEGTVSESFVLKLVAITMSDKKLGNETFEL